MPRLRRERPGHLAAVPDDVTDPLLWRLAIDVLAAHQPGHDGNCRNLQCVGQVGSCTAARNARRAMEFAGSVGSAFHARLLPRRPQLEARSFDGDAGREVGWFAPSTSDASTGWRPELALRRWHPALRSVA
ncbi:hypothetical protein E1258_22020 [Micromonospora sp. KC207]|nr:hypothetical protein E1258_22020 [Micromonospora sp. KC207]